MWVPRVPWPLTWALLQLSWQTGWPLEAPEMPWRSFTFSPASLMVTEGENATFTCSFSNWSDDFVLNWYRLSPNNQTDKQAAFFKGRSQPGKDPRFQVMQLPSGRDFHMNIIATQRNDSGIYFFGVISLSPTAQIKESPGAELIVPETRRAGNEEQSLKEDSSAIPVFSVTYGELDFQGRETTPEPHTPCVHTEYATIVFADGLGASSSSRWGSADGSLGLRPLKHEAGHCSWPL